MSKNQIKETTSAKLSPHSTNCSEKWEKFSCNHMRHFAWFGTICII